MFKKENKFTLHVSFQIEHWLLKAIFHIYYIFFPQTFSRMRSLSVAATNEGPEIPTNKLFIAPTRHHD